MTLQNETQHEAPKPIQEAAKRVYAPRGMSLLEIMVVIVLIGLVASMVGVQVMNSLESGQMDTASTQAKNIEAALDQYKLKFGSYPNASQGLGVLATPPKGAPIMDKVPQDPWGGEYIYQIPGAKNPRKFDIISKGPDQQESTEDDIGNWDREE